MKQSNRKHTYLTFFAIIAFWSLGTQGLIAQNQYKIAIDWSTISGTIDSAHWGVADYEIVNPENVSDPGFVDYMQRIDPAFIRIHRSTLSTRFTDANTETWDSAYIVACFDSAKMAYGDAKIMFNPMPEWPDWMNEPKVLSPEGEDKVIALLAQMASIIKNSGIHIDYWEIFNERDNDYEDGNALDRYFALYNRAYDTIKSVLPNAKIGGLAFTHPKYEWVTGFLDQCAGKYDFISWHNYSNGPDNKPNDSVMVVERPNGIVNQAEGVINQLKTRGLENDVESFLTEYNIQWVWDPIEVRHANHIGAMFQAAVVSRLAALELTGVAVWHNKGNAYGLINSKNEMRATGILYSWGNRYLAGNRVTLTDAPSRNKVEVIPILNHAKDSSILLLNKSSLQTKIPFEHLNIEGSHRILVLDHNSYYPYPIYIQNDTLMLPPMSATLLTTQPAQDNTPPETPSLSGFAQLNSITINVSNLSDETSFAGYKLFINQEMYGFFSNLMSMTIPGLDQGETYSFTAVSTDEEGNVSDTSDILILTTKSDTTGPTIPSRLSFDLVDQNHAEFTWNPSLDASTIMGYIIMVNGEILDTISETTYTLDLTGYSNLVTFSVYAFDEYGNDSDKATKEFVVSANNMKSINHLRIFPNPLSGKSAEFYVENQTKSFSGEKIIIYNALGKQIPVKIEKVNNHKIKIKFRNNNNLNGYYFIQITDGETILTNKLIIN